MTESKKIKIATIIATVLMSIVFVSSAIFIACAFNSGSINLTATTMLFGSVFLISLAIMIGIILTASWKQIKEWDEEWWPDE